MSPTGATCVDVAYLGDEEIPEGVRLTVTDLFFDPDVLDVADSECAEPDCLSDGFDFAVADQCTVAVKVEDPLPEGFDPQSDGTVSLGFVGQLLCPADVSCDDLIAELDQQPDTVTLTVQPAGAGED
ncbi:MULTISPECIES: hypothetical protein [unclassified Geodermatophilus]